MTPIKYDGESLNLRFDMQAWLELEDAGASFYEMQDAFHADERGRFTPEQVDKLLSYMAVFINSGYRQAGSARRVEAQDLRALTPAQFFKLRIAVMDEVSASMRFEAQDDRPARRDLVLEELDKKKEAASSATAG